METVVIIGSGIVGRSWAMLFASQGHQVRLYDAIPQALDTAIVEVQNKLNSWEKSGQLKNASKYSAKKQFQNIQVCKKLDEALTGATYVQECTPERVELKTAVFKQLNDALKAVGNTTAIVGSSTSTLLPSTFMSGVEIEKRSLVVHPVNPPYFVRFVELVPAPRTDPAVLQKVRGLLSSLGQKPVVLSKEIEGFALNRVQYVILNETWKLVNDGILSVEDADVLMKEGLAPRYIFMGPLETAQLNANGFVDYCDRYGEAIYKVSQTQTVIPKMEGAGAQVIDKQLQALVPDSKLDERRAWRDENLANLSAFKTKLGL